MYEVITVLQILVLFAFSIYFLTNKENVVHKIINEYGMNENVIKRYYFTGRMLSYFFIFVGLLLLYSLF
jgi:hypothetical protein